jgi:hypothetical protein
MMVSQRNKSAQSNSNDAKGIIKVTLCAKNLG